MKEMIELAKKIIKTIISILHLFKEVEEDINMVRREYPKSS